MNPTKTSCVTIYDVIECKVLALLIDSYLTPSDLICIASGAEVVIPDTNVSIQMLADCTVITHPYYMSALINKFNELVISKRTVFGQ